jgi:2-dehydropantoate 2-reductase
MAILGAGAVGAYVGGRLAQAGVPAAFLARGDHLHALARDGLRVDSPQGDFVVQP